MPLIFANVLQPLIDFFEAILKFFHNHVGASWGLSIILLTLVVRAALLPLTLRQFHSMQGLARLQPQIKELQAKYKDDKQRLNQEMMKFYQENKVNPLGSCLPLAAQLPVFFSLFYMLRKDLRRDICPDVNGPGTPHFHNPIPCSDGPHGAPASAHFLGIPDITNKAAGITLAILIILYVGSQLLSSLLMAVPGQDRNQRLILLAMPFVFVVFVQSFPAGLLVYWITTNFWTIIQQYIVRKRVGVISPAGGVTPAGARAANGAGGGRRSGGLLGALTAARQAAAPAGAGDGGAAKTDAVSKTEAVSKTDAAAKSTPAPKRGGDGKRAAGTGNGARSSDAVRTGSGGPPPPSPRKKKKRSGRRR